MQRNAVSCRTLTKEEISELVNSGAITPISTIRTKTGPYVAFRNRFDGGTAMDRRVRCR